MSLAEDCSSQNAPGNRTTAPSTPRRTTALTAPPIRNPPIPSPHIPLLAAPSAPSSLLSPPRLLCGSQRPPTHSSSNSQLPAVPPQLHPPPLATQHPRGPPALLAVTTTRGRGSAHRCAPRSALRAPTPHLPASALQPHLPVRKTVPGSKHSSPKPRGAARLRLPPRPPPPIPVPTFPVFNLNRFRSPAPPIIPGGGGLSPRGAELSPGPGKSPKIWLKKRP